MRYESNHFLETKIPPPVLLALFAGTMWLVSRFTPRLVFEMPFQSFFINVFALVGGTLSTLGFATFKRAGTTINPIKPESATALVSTGVYRFTRNPMYLGLALMLLAWAIFLENWLAFGFVPLFVAYMNRFQITPEERTLALKFGQAFADYKARVRRWL